MDKFESAETEKILGSDQRLIVTEKYLESPEGIMFERFPYLVDAIQQSSFNFPPQRGMIKYGKSGMNPEPFIEESEICGYLCVRHVGWVSLHA